MTYGFYNLTNKMRGQKLGKMRWFYYIIFIEFTIAYLYMNILDIHSHNRAETYNEELGYYLLSLLNVVVIAIPYLYWG